MPSPLTTRVKQWASEAMLSPRTIRIHFASHGLGPKGEVGAKVFLRKIQNALASVRYWERQKRNHIQDMREEPRLAVTMFEDVFITWERFNDRYEVTFHSEEDLDNLIDDKEDGEFDPLAALRDNRPRLVTPAEEVEPEHLPTGSFEEMLAIKLDPRTGKPKENEQ